MSIPPRGPQGKVMEDCRDYLRTGRCKYGASCKYNHPANVQNGGGIKPLDPSEPLFPSRPDEPVCQYFLKHGTCKFGQACKFDHPPQHAMQIMSGGGQMHVLNVGHLNEQAVPQLLLNPMGTETNSMVLQFLPQRVDEPDCIYFLKNGRCKYGATCRYHHPVHPQQTARRVVESKPRARQPDPFHRSGLKVQYVTQMVPSYQGGQQVLMSYDNNNPVAFINMDGTSGSAQSYQIIPSSDGVTSYCVPSGSVGLTEQGSSASSIASSSYETTQEHLNDQWSRSRRNGSGGSLSAYSNDGRQQRVFLSHSASEGNIARVQGRSSSYGSAGEMGVAPTGLPRNGSWSQRMQNIQYRSRQEPNPRSPVANNVQRRMMMRRRDRRGEGPDEGFTMMTSALLHMLDTPEEAAADTYSDEEYRQHIAEHYGANDEMDYDLFERMSLQDPSVAHEANLQGGSPSYVDPGLFEQHSIHSTYTSGNQLSQPSAATHGETSSSWSPTWLGAVQGLDDSGNAFSLMHHKSHAPASTISHDSDVGLYLP
jgi:hypothetical protein